MKFSKGCRKLAGVLTGVVLFASSLSSALVSVAYADTTAIISTITGKGIGAFSGDGRAAALADIDSPYSLVLDGGGNVYFTDTANNRIRKINTSGIITTVAGSDDSGQEGDGKAATNAQLNLPKGVALDSSGNMYIADTSNHKIRKVDTNGIITTLAGTGNYGFYGEGIDAKKAMFMYPSGIAVDKAGNVYVADTSNNRIRKIDTNGMITTIAGAGGSGVGQEGVPATAALLKSPSGINFDYEGNLYIADTGNHRIRKIDTNGIIKTIAGTGFAGIGGEGVEAAIAPLKFPSGVAVSESGSIYIADTSNNRIRKVDTNGIISTVAGTGASGYEGEGTAAISAKLKNPNAVALDERGNVYIADRGNSRIRKVVPALSGDAALAGLTLSSGALSPAFTAGTLSYSTSVANGVDSLTLMLTLRDSHASVTVNGKPASNGQAVVQLKVGGNPVEVVVTAQDGTTTRTYKVVVNREALPARISTIAGTGTAGFHEDGVAAGTAPLNYPRGVAVDSNDTVYIADTDNHRIRKIDTNGIISTIAGTGTAGFLGDGQAAVAAELNAPAAVAIDDSGNVYIADTNNNRVRKIDTNGIISTIAGTGAPGFPGEGEAAASAELNAPTGVAVDRSGNVYIADYRNHKIKKVDPNGLISTIAGTGTAGPLGDGGPSKDAELFNPYSVAIDKAGNLYIADQNNYKIRKIDTNGLISTIAGVDSGGVSADGIAALTARLQYPSGVAVDSSGNVYIAETNYQKIRKVDTNGIITTVAGTGTAGFKGDGASAVNAQFSSPLRVAVDSSGSLYVADFFNSRIRKITSAVSSDAALSGLTISSGTLTPAFAANTLSYSANAVNSVDSITVIPTARESHAAVTVNGMPLSSGQAVIHLSLGITPVTITVTAEDGTTTRSYTIDVSREATYTIEPLQTQTLSSLIEGYEPGMQETVTVTIARSGSGDLTNLAVQLSGTGAGSFEITGPLVTTLNEGTSATTFTLKAKDHLPVGSYSATVIVTADRMADVSFSIGQTVNKKSVKGDASGDGLITPADSAMIAQYMAGKITLTPEQIEALDMNGDGKLDGEDIKIIMTIYLESKK
jgi:sugar lactone lactonase YvrE